MVYTLRFFPLQNAVCFIILTYLVPVLFTFYIQGVLKIKKNNSGSKWLRHTQRRMQYFVRGCEAGSMPSALNTIPWRRDKNDADLYRGMARAINGIVNCCQVHNQWRIVSRFVPGGVGE